MKHCEMCGGKIAGGECEIGGIFHGDKSREQTNIPADQPAIPHTCGDDPELNDDKVGSK